MGTDGSWSIDEGASSSLESCKVALNSRGRPETREYSVMLGSDFVYSAEVLGVLSTSDHKAHTYRTAKRTFAPVVLRAVHDSKAPLSCRHGRQSAPFLIQVAG